MQGQKEGRRWTQEMDTLEHSGGRGRRRRGVCVRDPRSRGGGALEKSKDQSLGKESKGVCGFLGVLER